MHCKDTILRTQNNWPYSKLIPNSGIQWIAIRVIRFNPHPHAEGDKFSNGISTGNLCFNPHPHAEGDALSDEQITAIEVSIHTLTRRVTLYAM